jgi:hypothetical protein
MAKFLAINGKPLWENEMSDFVDFFTQHIFFKFMDSGREGMREGVLDLIDTSVARTIEGVTARNIGSRQSQIERQEKLASDAMRKQLFDENLPRIMNRFIISGTKGLREAVFGAATDPLMFE